MRRPGAAYRGEGRHALWHLSDGAWIERFDPHVSARRRAREPRVWAVDPRRPFRSAGSRASARAGRSGTSPAYDGRGRRAPGRSVACAHRREWLAVSAMRSCRRWSHIGCPKRPSRRTRGRRILAEPRPVGPSRSSSSCRPRRASRGARASSSEGAVENIWPTWDRVVASSLEFNGIRLPARASPRVAPRRAGASSPSRADEGTRPGARPSSTTTLLRRSRGAPPSSSATSATPARSALSPSQRTAHRRAARAEDRAQPRRRLGERLR